MYGTEIDIWAFGCILAEVAKCTLLLQGKDNADQLFTMIAMLGPIAHADISAMPRVHARTPVCTAPARLAFMLGLPSWFPTYHTIRHSATHMDASTPTHTSTYTCTLVRTHACVHTYPPTCAQAF